MTKAQTYKPQCINEISVTTPFTQEMVNVLLHEIATCYPRANANGLTEKALSGGKDVLHWLDNEKFVREVNTAYHWISCVALSEPLRKTTNTFCASYAIKHMMEKWGDKNGLAPYVCNMAGILVMHSFTIIKLEVKGDYGNPYTNISDKILNPKVSLEYSSVHKPKKNIFNFGEIIWDGLNDALMVFKENNTLDSFTKAGDNFKAKAIVNAFNGAIATTKDGKNILFLDDGCWHTIAYKDEHLIMIKRFFDVIGFSYKHRKIKAILSSTMCELPIEE